MRVGEEAWRIQYFGGRNQREEVQFASAVEAEAQGDCSLVAQGRVHVVPGAGIHIQMIGSHHCEP